MSALILLIGSLFGGSGGWSSPWSSRWRSTRSAYFFSDKLALRAMRARPVTEAEHPAFYRIVRELPTARPADAAAVRVAVDAAERVRHRP